MLHSQHTPKNPFTERLADLCGAFAAALTGLGAAPGDAPMPSVVGLWYNTSSIAAVDIHPCSENKSHLCGNIVWLKEPYGKDGQPLKDVRNGRASLRGRPICGLPVLGSLKPTRRGGWDGGWVYDPQRGGRSYDAAIKLASPNRLILTGYIGFKFLGENFTWKLAPNDLPRCSAEPAGR